MFAGLLLFGLASLSFCSGICMDDNGKPVDSWFMAKAPAGTQSIYYDQAHAGFITPTHDLNSTTGGPLANTLNQVWADSSTEFIMFNDEPPVGTTEMATAGHTKGVWAWSLASKSAFILQHSVPKFPLGPGSTPTYKGLGGNARIYGQHFACFSLSLDDLVSLAAIAPLTAPAIYQTRVSANTPAALAVFANGTDDTGARCDSVQVANITYFAKSSQWNNELYAACVAPGLATPLVVESWIRGSAEGPSCSTGYQVTDVQNLAFPGLSPFSEHSDHSKWAVAKQGGWVCPADINRMTTQFARGGSAFCFQDATLAAVLQKSITATDSC
jgi:deoxyribonuclease-2